MNNDIIKCDDNHLYDLGNGELYSLSELKEFANKCNTSRKKLNSILSLTRRRMYAAENELEEIKSMTMFEFANKYCSPEEQEDAGKAFAKELLGGV